MQTILKKCLDQRKVCARWVPHLLSEEQKTQCLKCARELLKTYKGCKSRVIFNLLTGDETWVHMLSHKEGLIISNVSEKIKNTHVLPREPLVRKRCCTQFSLIQVGQSFKCLVHSVIQSLADSTRILYWRKWKSFSIRNKQAKDGQESTFYMTMPPLISVRLLSLFLASEKVKVLNHPPYSPDLSPCDFFLFPRLKKMLSVNKYTSRSSLGSAIYLCLRQIPKEDYLSAFRDWVKRLQKCVSVKGEYFEGL